MTHVVIMAGGIGSRFWPMSSESVPKQFLDVIGTGKSLLQMTVERFLGICSMEQMWIVTSRAFREQVRQQLPELPESNILLEPCRRNTAPCIAYVSWVIKSLDPNANIVVSPSDHAVTDVQKFRRAIAECLEFTAQSDAIVTLGMQPDRPETGYGYIEADLSYATLTNKNIFRVDSFKEKPTLEVAQQYIQKPNYYWNSGIFVWNVSTVVNAFRMYQPALNDIFESMAEYFGTDKEQEIINERYAECENISVDYAIMEKAEEIYVFPADFGWSDLGTWGSLHTLSKKDSNNNALIGENIKTFETSNCLINVKDAEKVVVQGLDGYIVAERDGRLLICKLSEEQRIKEFSK